MANGYNPPKLLPGQLDPSEVAPQAGPNGKYIIGARPSPHTPNAGLSATHGMGPHGATPGQPGVRGGMTPTQVRAMQQFLNNHGFQVAQDGIMGPQTKSAAAAFRANHKGGDAWSKTNGINVHPGLSATTGMGPHHGPGYNPNPGGDGSGSGGTGSGAGTGTGTDGTDAGGALQALLQSLLGGGGNVGTGYDANSFGNAAAAPDMATAQALARQIGANPKQEAQNQADISQWYGLDPKGAGYKLSVLGRLAQAKAGDAQAATDIGGNMGDLAKSLAGSIGGAANDGSGSVLAAGQNSAGTVAALGQAQSDYESNMDPLLRAEAVGAASREKGSNSQALLDLQDKLAAARGQAQADRAGGVMGATDKNNALAQQRFANQGNLLSTLAQMQAADPNSTANTLSTAKTKAQINEINAQTAKAKAAAMHLVNGSSTPKQTKASLGDLTAQIGGIAGIGADHRLPPGMSIGGVAHLVGTTLQSAGIPKSDPRYQRIAQTIMGSFLDPNGNPLNVPPGWFGPNTQ
jgi:hypothetical protein